MQSWRSACDGLAPRGRRHRAGRRAAIAAALAVRARTRDGRRPEASVSRCRSTGTSARGSSPAPSTDRTRRTRWPSRRASIESRRHRLDAPRWRLASSNDGAIDVGGALDDALVRRRATPAASCTSSTAGRHYLLLGAGDARLGAVDGKRVVTRREPRPERDDDDLVAARPRGRRPPRRPRAPPLRPGA